MEDGGKIVGKRERQDNHIEKNKMPQGDDPQLNTSLTTVSSLISDTKTERSSSYVPTFDGNENQTISLVSLSSRAPHATQKELPCKIVKEMSIPFFLAGLAMVAAGILLEYFTTWSVYKKIPAMVILTTPLLGLKGDLEMTLGSRLSTQANLGNLDGKKLRNQICFANLCLDQHQAIICAVVATIVAALTKLCYNPEKIEWDHVLIMCSASILTSSIVSIVLGSIMVFTVVSSRKCHMNPDNIASPIAGTLGDIVTLTVLSLTAQWIFIESGKNPSRTSWISYFIIAVYLGIVTPLCGVVAHRNKYTKHALVQGWLPVIFSVVLSTVGGVFLDLAQGDASDVALYQPLINGIGGNLASVQSSRGATYLHKYYTPGILPEGESLCFSPHKVFFGKGEDVLSARLLLLFSIPGHIMFAAAAHIITKYGRSIADKHYGLVFMLCFLLAELCQVSLLFYICKLLANFSWKRKLDPDTFSIPYLTAFGDLFGSGFLIFNYKASCAQKRIKIKMSFAQNDRLSLKRIQEEKNPDSTASKERTHKSMKPEI